MKTKYVIFLGLALLAAVTGRAGVGRAMLERLAPVPAFPATRAAAAAAGIELKAIVAGARTNGLVPGDTTTMLVTLREKGGRTQWLMHLRVLPATNGPAAKPAAPTVLYTCTGGRYEFARSPATVSMRTLGPFAEFPAGRKKPSGHDNHVQIEVDQNFLGLGLDQATAAMARFESLREQEQVVGKEFKVSAKPFTSSQISDGRKVAERLHITPVEERALAGGIPALVSYLNTVQQTPDLESILSEVLSWPSVWSVVKNCGITPEIQIGHQVDRLGPLSLPDWDLLAGWRLYSLPIKVSLNRHDALILSMIVTAPQPPLLACGGIVGFLAENPDDPENYLTLRVISARCGEVVPQAAPNPPAVR